MDDSMVTTFATLVAVLVAVIALPAPIYLRLGRLEGEIVATRERPNEQFREARERSDEQFRVAQERSEAQYKELREHSDAQHRELLERHKELRGWAEGQFRESRERSDAQHGETLREIRRLTDAFLSHSHAPDGGIIFRIPPPEGSTSLE